MIIYSLYTCSYGGKELHSLVDHFTTRKAAERIGRRVVRLSWFHRNNAYGTGLDVFDIMRFTDRMKERFPIFREGGHHTTVVETLVRES